MKLIENTDYLKLLLLYKGTGDAAQFEEELKKGGSNTLSNATTGYGLGMFHLVKGNKSKAKEIFDVIINGNQWSSFGFIAAQEELKRRSY
ncbi:MAG: hypothetical protein HC867_09130 [Bacteroidia bacterium]|nr:hypothetical protein [Bacteroidia bacterium]